MQVSVSRSYFGKVAAAGSLTSALAEAGCLERVLPLANAALSAIEGMRDSVVPECTFRREYFRIEGLLAALAGAFREGIYTLMRDACWDVSIRVRLRIIRQALDEAANVDAAEDGLTSDDLQTRVNVAEMLRTAEWIDEYAFERAVGRPAARVQLPSSGDPDAWIAYAAVVVLLNKLGRKRGAHALAMIRDAQDRVRPTPPERFGLGPELALATIRRLLNEIASERVNHEYVGSMIEPCMQALTALEDAVRSSCPDDALVACAIPEASAGTDGTYISELTTANTLLSARVGA